METHLRLPQASREEIKPEMDVLVTRGRAAVWQQVGTPLGWGVGTESQGGHKGCVRGSRELAILGVVGLRLQS